MQIYEEFKLHIGAVLQPAKDYLKIRDKASSQIYTIGMCYILGIGGVEKNIAEGVKYLQQGYHKRERPKNTLVPVMYDKKPEDFAYVLGDLFYHGRFGLKKDMQEAKKYLDFGAQQGHGPSAKFLGDLYFYGKDGVEKNLNEAAKYYKYGFERKGGPYAPLCYEYGFMVHHGQGGLKQDCQLALKAYGHVFTLNYSADFKKKLSRIIADIYDTGQGNVPQNKKEALERFWTLARDNDAYAMYKMGELIFNGNSASEDLNKDKLAREKKALEWFKKANEQGDLNAPTFIGWMHENGLGGLVANKAEALRYYEIASARNNNVGAFNAGLIYENGISGKSDYNKALQFYQRAKELGNPKAADSIARISALLTKSMDVACVPTPNNLNNNLPRLPDNPPTCPKQNPDPFFNSRAQDASTNYIYRELNIPFTQIQITGKLGEGGFGVVSKGIWKKADLNPRDVALKTLKSGCLADDKLEEFNREMKNMYHLRHPCLITLYGVSIDYEQNRFLVLEFASYGSLRKMLENKDNVFNLKTSFRIMSGIAQGLSYLHNQDYLHRDLKSHNILMMENYQPKIADFGLSKFVAATQQYYTLGATGTINWMAPELFSDGKGEVKFNKEADIYSLTMVFYEILSGKMPFEDVFPFMLVAIKVIAGTRPDIPSKTRSNELVPDALKLLMKRGWAQEVKERPRAPIICEELEAINQTIASLNRGSMHFAK